MPDTTKTAPNTEVLTQFIPVCAFLPEIINPGQEENTLLNLNEYKAPDPSEATSGRPFSLDTTVTQKTTFSGWDFSVAVQGKFCNQTPTFNATGSTEKKFLLPGILCGTFNAEVEGTKTLLTQTSVVTSTAHLNLSPDKLENISGSFNAKSWRTDTGEDGYKIDTAINVQFSPYGKVSVACPDISVPDREYTVSVAYTRKF